VDALALVLRGDTTKSVIDTQFTAPQPVETPPVGTTTVTTKPSSSAPVIEKKTFGSGNKYEGETVNGVPHGKGKKTFADGYVYEGDFVDGDLVKGKITFKDGFSKEGEFKGGWLLWGKGKKHRQEAFIMKKVIS